jgi:hypothetical protein
MADGAPMSYDWAWIAMDVHPADQGIASPRDEQPAAFRAEAREELPSDRCDVGDIDRKKWEPPPRESARPQSQAAGPVRMPLVVCARRLARNDDGPISGCFGQAG